MASYSSYGKNRKSSRGEDNELVPVRSNVLYGIETKKINEQKSTVKREIFVVPNITFYSNFTKVLIDFSDYKNNQEKADIKQFFDVIASGYSFTLANAKWNNRSIDEITYNLSGTFTFTKIADNIIFADVVSISTYNTNITRYDKEYFTELPLVEFSSTINKQKVEVKSYIFNHLGQNSKNSFSYLGARSGDYIELQIKKEKYKIDSISLDNEGKETVVVFGDMGNSSNIGSPVLVTLHQHNINKIQLTYDNEKTGKCELYNDGVLVGCLDSHTLLQSKLREDTLNKITTTFNEGAFCSSVVSVQTEETIQNIIPVFTQEIAKIRESQRSSNITPSQINSSLLSRTNLINNIFKV
jgi:hypothetical protein